MTTKTQRQSHDEALALLQLEYMAKRREIERDKKRAARKEREQVFAETRKLIRLLKRTHGQSNEQIVKRLSLVSS